MDGDRLIKDPFVTASRLAVIDTSRLNVTEGSGHAIFDIVDVDNTSDLTPAAHTSRKVRHRTPGLERPETGGGQRLSGL
ncbi:hypothetical protein [Streptomyces werraensis]|uniref:hypothetical protein n=1 Tax=Streptomyces werraensis TaxID=68284 RepID=UPI003445CAA7